jgi:hypothetical protein
MDHNFFIKISSGILLVDKRLREHIDFCKRALDSADSPQYKILCMYTLGGCYREVGDAVSTREIKLKLLETVDSDRSIIYKIPSLQEVMEDMCVKSCEIMGEYAISYSEYETYMHKIKEIRPLTELQKGQLELIESLKNEGRDWTYNIMQLVQSYQKNNRFGDAASLNSLLLTYRRQLRVSRDDINLAIYNYAANIYNLVLESMIYCKQKTYPCNPYNYLFILEKAIDLICEFQKDMSTKTEADDAIAKLNQQKNSLEEIQRRAVARFYDYTAPGYMSPEQLEEAIRENESREKIPILPGFRQATKAEQKEAVLNSIKGLIFSGVCVYLGISGVYADWGLNMDKSWGKTFFFILAFVCAFISLFIYKARKIRRLK